MAGSRLELSEWQWKATKSLPIFRFWCSNFWFVSNMRLFIASQPDPQPFNRIAFHPANYQSACRHSDDLNALCCACVRQNRTGMQHFDGGGLPIPMFANWFSFIDFSKIDVGIDTFSHETNCSREMWLMIATLSKLVMVGQKTANPKNEMKKEKKTKFKEKILPQIQSETKHDEISSGCFRRMRFFEKI